MPHEKTSFFSSFPTWRMVGGDDPSYLKFGAEQWPRSSGNADFQSIFAHSAPAITPSENSSINTNRKSTASFLMSLRWTVYVVRKPPKGVENAKWLKFEQQSAMTSKRYETGCQLVLITNRKSHIGFQLVPTSETSNDLQRRSSPCVISPNLIALQAYYVTLIECRPGLMAAKYRLPCSHIGPKMTYTAVARSFLR